MGWTWWCTMWYTSGEIEAVSGRVAGREKARSQAPGARERRRAGVEWRQRKGASSVPEDKEEGDGAGSWLGGP